MFFHLFSQVTPGSEFLVGKGKKHFIMKNSLKNQMTLCYCNQLNDLFETASVQNTFCLIIFRNQLVSINNWLYSFFPTSEVPP